MVLLRSVPRSSTSWLPLAPACRFPDRCRTPPCTRRSRTHILFRHKCWWELCSCQLPCRILDRSCSSPLPWGQPTRKSEHFEFHQDWQNFLQTGRAPRTLGDATIFPRGPSRALCLASRDRKSTRLNSSHSQISYAVFCLKKKNNLGNLLLLGKIGVFHNRRNASSRLLLLISKHLILCIYLVFRILSLSCRLNAINLFLILILQDRKSVV